MNQELYLKISRNDGYMKFRSKLAIALFKASHRRKAKPAKKPTSMYYLVNPAPVNVYEMAGKLYSKLPKACEACRSARRVITDIKIKRKPLGELNPNNLVVKKRRNRFPRPLDGYILCMVHLYNTIRCWNDYIDIVKAYSTI